MFGFLSRRIERDWAAKIEAEKLTRRYGGAKAARERCDELLSQHDDRRKLRFLTLVRRQLDKM